MKHETTACIGLSTSLQTYILVSSTVKVLSFPRRFFFVRLRGLETTHSDAQGGYGDTGFKNLDCKIFGINTVTATYIVV